MPEEVTETAAPEPSKKSRRFKIKPGAIIAIIGVGLLLTGFGLLYVRYAATHGVAELPNPKVVVASTAAPAETKPAPAAVAEYSVPADQPRDISISSVGLDGLVQRVGVTKDNAMGVPSNVNFAGWYTNSVKPGEPGLSIINGHVSGIYSDGIFKRLASVKADDVITVQFGDKSIKKFAVVDTKSLAEADSAAYLFTKRDTIDSQLNLITCGGKYNAAKHAYDNRVIVVAKLIGT